MGTTRMMSALETLRRRKADVRSALQRTEEALARASRVMKAADEAVERTEDLVNRGLNGWRVR
jgi:ElaB/YqjD/DUF883 family membrane-anchored ribosome-binding protein